MTEAEKNLRENQRQLDADGVMVGVSRQAVHEVLAETDRLRAALEYALPLVKSYAHTQGDSAAYHAELVRPIEDALKHS